MRSVPSARHALVVLVSLSCAVGLGLVAARFVDLWPSQLSFPRPELLLTSAALFVPYLYLRSHRMVWLLDAPKSVPTHLLHGAGLVSFFWVFLLPLRLGELSRPWLMARAGIRGAGGPETLGLVVLERLVDGFIVCAMLFGGLAASSALHGSLEIVRAAQLMLAVFALGLGLVLLAARAPRQAVTLVGKATRRLPRADLVATAAERLVHALGAIAATRRTVPFIAVSLLYWAITVASLELSLRGCGLDLGTPEAMVIVAVVALSIQLPGGPAQTGSFQLGTSLALSLFVSEDLLVTRGSTFVWFSYASQVVGTAIGAAVGMALLAGRRVAPEAAAGTSQPPPRAPGGP